MSLCVSLMIVASAVVVMIPTSKSPRKRSARRKIVTASPKIVTRIGQVVSRASSTGTSGDGDFTTMPEL